MTNTLEQLRAEATTLGIKVHHKHSEDTLREMIALKRNAPEIVQLPTFDYADNLEEIKPVRVKMINGAGHYMDVLYEDVSKYEAEGWSLTSSGE